MQKEINEAIKKLRLLPFLYFSKIEKRKILRQAAKPLIQAARNNIGDSDEPHYRYKTSKASSNFKAPKGSGNVIAVYHPGNLRKSIRVLTFRKSSDIFVGPKLAKRGSGGHYKGNTVDGYYAAFMEFGTRHMAGSAYMRRAVPVATTAVQRIIIDETKKTIDKFVIKNKI